MTLQLHTGGADICQTRLKNVRCCDRCGSRYHLRAVAGVISSFSARSLNVNPRRRRIVADKGREYALFAPLTTREPPTYERCAACSATDARVSFEGPHCGPPYCPLSPPTQAVLVPFPFDLDERERKEKTESLLEGAEMVSESVHVCLFLFFSLSLSISFPFSLFSLFICTSWMLLDRAYDSDTCAKPAARPTSIFDERRK